MTSPLSKEQRVELARLAKVAEDNGRIYMPSTILAYEATVVALTEERDADPFATMLLKWFNDPERDHDLHDPEGYTPEDFRVMLDEHEIACTEDAMKALAERDAALERVKEAEEFAAFVARHSDPARRAGLSDKEFRSIVEHYPAVQDLITKSTERKDG